MLIAGEVVPSPLSAGEEKCSLPMRARSVPPKRRSSVERINS